MRLVDESTPNTSKVSPRNNNNAVLAGDNVTYTKVRGTYKYLPFCYRITGERVNPFPGYTRKEEAELAVTKLLASNSSLRATPITEAV